MPKRLLVGALYAIILVVLFACASDPGRHVVSLFPPSGGGSG